jgi:hypothetical protein
MHARTHGMYASAIHTSKNTFFICLLLFGDQKRYSKRICTLRKKPRFCTRHYISDKLQVSLQFQSCFSIIVSFLNNSNGIDDFLYLYVKLTPKHLANLDTYLSLLPEIIEFHMVDSANNDISCDCTGFFLDVGMVFLKLQFRLGYVEFLP